MKNRFGFIPIVLPAIIMVLIIGLINLGGPPSVQADHAISPHNQIKIVPDKGNFNPAFDKTKGHHTFELPFTEIEAKLTVEVEKPNAEVTAVVGDGATYVGKLATLPVGPGQSKVLTITVTFSGDSEDYEIIVKRAGLGIVKDDKIQIFSGDEVDSENVLTLEPVASSTDTSPSLHEGNEYTEYLTEVPTSTIATVTVDLSDLKSAPLNRGTRSIKIISPATATSTDGKVYTIPLNEIPAGSKGSWTGIEIELSHGGLGSEATSTQVYTVSVARNVAKDVRAPRVAKDGKAQLSSVAVTLSGVTLMWATTTDSETGIGFAGGGVREYTAEVDYPTTSTSLTVDPGSSTTTVKVNGKIKIAATTTENTVLVPLVVGDTEIEITVESAGLPNGSYTITVTRNAPEPTLEFELLDADRKSVTSTVSFPLKLKLDAQSRTKNLVEETDLVSDDLLTLDAIRVGYRDLGDGGIGGVTISHKGVEVPKYYGGDKHQYLGIGDLPDGRISLRFEVTYETGDGNEEARSTHIIIIDRKPNSVPAFLSNDPLHGRMIDLLADQEIGANSEHNIPIELPFARGGNGTIEYTLLGDEAKGTLAELPQGLVFNSPVLKMDGSVTGTPKLLPESDEAVHHLILTAKDSDAIEGADDEDTLEFSVRIVRDSSQITGRTDRKPDPGELHDIEVFYASTTADTIGRNEEADLVPVFDPGVMSYTVYVPTDVDEVKIEVSAADGATVRLQGLETSATSFLPNDTSVTVSTWGGLKLNIGGAAPVNNRYTITVQEDGESNTYRLNVIRRDNTAPQLPSDSGIIHNYYEGISIGNDDLPATVLPEATSGNGARVYELKRRAANLSSDEFLGLSFNVSSRELSGKPELDTERDRSSDYSTVLAVYTVSDSDEDESAGDSDSQNVDIRVYRNLALRSYTVSGDTVLVDDEAAWRYRYSRSYRYDDSNIESYTYPVSHDAIVATLEVEAWDEGSAKAAINPADADGSVDGHQVSLTPGENEVTVTVRNGNLSATHVLSLSRPGLQAEVITVREDEDARDNGTLENKVTLSPVFNRKVSAYTATVANWVRSVQVEATPVDPDASVLVNTFAVPAHTGYHVVNVPKIGADDPNIITVGISLGGKVENYTLSIVRESDVAPEFSARNIKINGVEDSDNRISRTVGRELKYAIELPEATGGNKPLTYSVVAEELPPGLTFATMTNADNTISGTPSLDEGYESDFEITYTVVDADSNMAASDSDTITFTITVTHDQVDETVVDPDDPPSPADLSKLSDLVVTYDRGGSRNNSVTLAPAFDKDSGGPYAASIPHDATNVQVVAVPIATEPIININNVRIGGGVKVDLPPTATIVVSNAGGDPSSMTYTLNTVETQDTSPIFGGAIEDMTFESGEDIDPVTLSSATGGNGTLVYGLNDHQGRIPEGLSFTAASRELSGRPVLLRDAVQTVYRMTYTATDENGDAAEITFRIKVCDPAQASGCSSTQVTNPGSTPIDLTVRRVGTSATIDWTPGDDTASQLVVALMPSDVNGTLKYDSVGGDVDTHTFSDLQSGVYLFGVIGIDANGGYGTPGNYFVARIMQ